MSRTFDLWIFGGFDSADIQLWNHSITVPKKGSYVVNSVASFPRMRESIIELDFRIRGKDADERTLNQSNLSWNILEMLCFGSVNALLLKKINIPTPVEMAKSATLKIALKKRKLFPPQNGSQLGNVPSQMGK